MRKPYFTNQYLSVNIISGQGGKYDSNLKMSVSDCPVKVCRKGAFLILVV